MESSSNVSDTNFPDLTSTSTPLKNVSEQEFQKPKPAALKRKKKIGRRRRFSHRKRHRGSTSQEGNQGNASGEEVLDSEFSSDDVSNPDVLLASSSVTSSMLDNTSVIEATSNNSSACFHDTLNDQLNVACETEVFDLGCHDYAMAVPEILVADGLDSVQDNSPELLKAVAENLQCRLPLLWTIYVEEKCVFVLKLSSGDCKAVQRSLRFSLSGDVLLRVHCYEVPIEPYLKNVRTHTALTLNTVVYFCDRILDIVANVRLKEVCAGIDKAVFRDAWRCLDLGEIDRNPHQECRYVETFRSLSCERLVEPSTWKCKECAKLLPFLKRRHTATLKDNFNPSTANKYLTDDQKLLKMKTQQEKIEAYRKKVSYLQDRMQLLLSKEGVTIDSDLSQDLMKIVEGANVSPVQAMFLQQQIKASQKKNMCGMRWHPSMIRVALAIHLTSPAAYELLRDTGVVKLPSRRTLFDYSHAESVSEGIDAAAIKSVAEKVDKVANDYQRFHVLMADEMYISKNLVFNKGTGELVGYMKLNELDKEIKLLENYLDDPAKKYDFEQSSKMLVYMVKGVSNNVQEAVASYSVSSVSVKQMYVWTWDLIGALERSGICIIAFTCDASATNRAFIKLHTPVTETASGVIFDTVNKVTPSRVMYFFSDVPHLLKTIRNCFNNSRLHKKGKRCLVKNGEKIVWDTIVNLYNLKRGKTLRKSYKLNAQNVYPDSYSCMKVGLAAQIMSRTVAADIKKQNWQGTAETVEFIERVNDWFDSLNGAHSQHGVRTRNERLNPYRDVNDPRFDELLGFLSYLEDWKKKAEDPRPRQDDSVASSTRADGNASVLSEDAIPLLEEDEDNTPAAKTQLSHQTLLGIEMTIRSFIGATRFLLGEAKTKYINARVFCQDPLERFFGKQRAGGGGSTNPNMSQFLGKQRAILIQGQLGMKRKGNTETSDGRFELTNESLPKRKTLRSLQEL